MGRYRGSGDVQPPLAEQAPAGVLPNGCSPFCGSVRVRSSREPQKRSPDSGPRWRFRLFRGVCEDEHRSAERKTADLRLDTRHRSDEELVDPVKQVSVDVYETLQGPFGRGSGSGPVEKRATAARRRRNQVPPALYHVWSHAETPENQHPSRPPSSGSAAGTTSRRMGRPNRRAGSCRLCGGTRTRFADSVNRSSPT